MGVQVLSGDKAAASSMQKPFISMQVCSSVKEYTDHAFYTNKIIHHEFIPDSNSELVLVQSVLQHPCCCIMTVIPLPLSGENIWPRITVMVNHLLYFPDLASRNFFFLPRLKLKLREKRFHDILETQLNLKEVLQEITTEVPEVLPAISQSNIFEHPTRVSYRNVNNLACSLLPYTAVHLLA
jgi:hypothetical protein